jgi:hypothetical protein
MSVPLSTCSKEEQRSVIRFLSSEGVKPIKIHQRMKVQHGDACLSLQQVYEWTRKFMNCISSVTVSPRPGQTHPVVTPEAIAAVEAIVKENRRITVYLFVFNKLRDKKYVRFFLTHPRIISCKCEGKRFVPVLHRIQFICFRQANNLMLFQEIFGAFCDNHKKHLKITSRSAKFSMLLHVVHVVPTGVSTITSIGQKSENCVHVVEERTRKQSDYSLPKKVSVRNP